MSKPPNKLDVHALREKHPSITYRSYTLEPRPEGLRIQFTFELENGPTFTPHVVLPCAKPFIDGHVKALAFRIGLVELLSYWKSSCPARILIAADYLPQSETSFWYDLLQKGLGEFFFLNKISPHLPVEIESLVPTTKNSATRTAATHRPKHLAHSYMVLVGGGKDSIVSLELLKSLEEDNKRLLLAFSINPIQASLQAIASAQYPPPLLGTRTIDPKLLTLNANGYLNGHTPYSALLAFASTLTGYLNSVEIVLASNESSASEGNVLFHEVEINHQYSKSVEFEVAFRHLMTTLGIPVAYCSLLRPLNELQICKIFSGHHKHFSIFRSCNRSQTIAAKEAARQAHGEASTTWCGCCPKCIFTFLCLGCFLDKDVLSGIFGVLPSAHPEFVEIVRGLSGMEAHKPFECVGTYNEVRACLQYIITKKPELFQSVLKPITELAKLFPETPVLSDLLSEWDQHNFLPLELKSLVERALTNEAL